MPRASAAYARVFLTFARNSLVRDMTFRANFIIETISTLCWMTISLLFYLLIFQFTDEIGAGTGWHKYEYFVFLATTMIISGLMQMFVLPNINDFSELIRTGNLDFALLKPIDTQFLISFQRIDWSSLADVAFGAVLLGYALPGIGQPPGLAEALLYPLYLLVGATILYSLLVCLASTSVWMGRNQSLYDFWFYITTFSRYPLEIFRGKLGDPIRFTFTFVIPIMVATNVPARLLALPLAANQWPLACYALAAAAASLLLSRRVFFLALRGYRSASS